MECEGISTICSEYAGVPQVSQLALCFYSECMSRTSFQGTKVAPALQLTVGSHVDNRVILVIAKGKEMAIGESLEMYHIQTVRGVRRLGRWMFQALGRHGSGFRRRPEPERNGGETSCRLYGAGVQYWLNRQWYAHAT